MISIQVYLLVVENHRHGISYSLFLSMEDLMESLDPSVSMVGSLMSNAQRSDLIAFGWTNYGENLKNVVRVFKKELSKDLK